MKKAVNIMKIRTKYELKNGTYESPQSFSESFSFNLCMFESQHTHGKEIKKKTNYTIKYTEKILISSKKIIIGL